MTIKDFLWAYEFTGRGEYDSDYEEDKETQRIVVSAGEGYEYFDLLAADYYDIIHQDKFADIFSNSFCWSVLGGIMYINIVDDNYMGGCNGLSSFQINYTVSEMDSDDEEDIILVENSTVDVEAISERDTILFALTELFHNMKESDDMESYRYCVDYNKNKIVVSLEDTVVKVVKIIA